MQKHPRQMRLRQFVPPMFVGFLIFSSLFALFSSVARTILVIGVAAYALANLAASTLTAAKNGWKFFPYLVASFAILHVSYGAGFLNGLVKFFNRWKPEVRDV